MKKGGKKTEQMHKVPWYTREVSFGRVGLTDLVMLSKHMAVMLGAGLPVADAIEALAAQASGTLGRVLKRIHRRIIGGVSLAESLEDEKRIFSPVFRSTVYIGEQSGTLSENLARLAEQMKKELDLRRNVQSALLYPVIVLIVAGVLGMGAALYILPELTSVFAGIGVDLPLSTRILIFLAELFDAHGTSIAIISVLVVIGMIVFVRLPFIRPIVDRVMLYIPILGEFVHARSRAQFCFTLHILLSSGVPVDEALTIVERNVPNRYYRENIQQITKGITSGSSLADLLADHPSLFPVMIERMVRVGESSGSLGDTLGFLATYYEERVLVMAKNLSSLLEPVLLIVMGLIVAFLATAILTPIYSITSGLE